MAEARLYVDSRMSDSHMLSIAGGDAAVFCNRSPYKEGRNEDCAAVIPYKGGAAVLAVADGAGGTPSAADASRLALEALHDAMTQGARNGAELRPAVINGIEAANRAVCDLGVGAATTVAVVPIRDGQLRPIHVGDSVILLSGQRGKVKFLSVPHGPVGYAVEAGLIDEREAMHHEDRHIVSNVVGIDSMKIDVGPRLAMDARDTLVIASDGLFDNLHPEEIVAAVRKGPLHTAARTLIDLCARRMTAPEKGLPSKPDDLTFILFRRR